jgi:hypothetical protein
MKPSAGARLGRQARGEKVPSAFTVTSHSMPSGPSTMVYGFGIVSTFPRKGRDIRKSNRGACASIVNRHADTAYRAFWLPGLVEKRQSIV